jgi:predicted PurR-regulated permease PerM
MPRISSKSPSSVPGFTVVAWILAAAALFLILYLHLLGALLAGLLVYHLVHHLAPLVQRRLPGQRSRLIALAAIAVVTIGLLVLLALGIIAFFKSETGTFPALLDRVQGILDDARTRLPPWLVENLPGDANDLKALLFGWLHTHSAEVQSIGRHALHFFVRALIGMVIGAIVSLHEERPAHQLQPLATALVERVKRFADAFQRIVFAQARISLLNTIFTALFVLVALPLFGVNLPLAKTLVAFAFFTGLLPVVGNLISNTAIVIAALSISIYPALAALAFLIVIHKLEYFLNARIVGAGINARAWELLIAMIVMEAAFGIAGLIAAPIYYAYIKAELRDAGCV